MYISRYFTRYCQQQMPLQIPFKPFKETPSSDSKICFGKMLSSVDSKIHLKKWPSVDLSYGNTGMLSSIDSNINHLKRCHLQLAKRCHLLQIAKYHVNRIKKCHIKKVKVKCIQYAIFTKENSRGKLCHLQIVNCLMRNYLPQVGRKYYLKK